jgi:YD repeat-containing protein
MRRWWFYILVAIVFGNLASPTTALASYTYDALGRRVDSNVTGRKIEDQRKGPEAFALQEI